MNDDDLLFGLEEIEAWKRGERPDSWLQERKDVLVARCRAQSAALSDLLKTANQTVASAAPRACRIASLLPIPGCPHRIAAVSAVLVLSNT